MSRTICVIYSEDVLPWATFIKNLFLKQRTPKYEVRSVLTEDLVQASPSSAPPGVEDAEVLIAVLSPEHLLFLRDHPDFTYHGLARGGQKGVLLFCGASKDDLEGRDPDGRDLRSRFPSYNDWTTVDHSDANSLTSILEKIQPLPSLVYQLIPDRVRCEGDSTVTVSFSDVIAAKSADLQMALYLSNNDGISEENVEVKWMNDKSVFFKTPERREGPAKVRVTLKGNQIPGTSSLRYESSCELVSDIMQLYIHTMNHLVSLVLSKSLISNNELDTFLFKIYSEDEPKGIQPKAFEELFGIYRYNPNMKSQVELPTLLHFANKYGFEKFHSWLQNLPDAKLASGIQNCDGLQAEKVNRFKNKAGVPPAVPCLPFKPPANDHLPEEPDEDYLDMETTTRMRIENKKKSTSDNSVWKPDISIIKEHQTDQESFDDIYTTLCASEDEEAIEEFYESFDKPCDSTAEEKDCFHPQTTTSQGERTVQQSSGATMDHGQQRLIEIMTQVKLGELTLEEANILFKEWKIQHSEKPSRSNLVSRTKQSPYETTASSSKPPAILKDVKAAPALLDPPPSRTGRKRGSDVSDKHSSTASTSSLDSSRSSTASATLSYSSGIDVDPSDEDINSRRSSGGSIDGSSVAPPLPARDVRPLPNKSVTLPRLKPGFSKFEGPSGKNDRDKVPRSQPRR